MSYSQLGDEMECSWNMNGILVGYKYIYNYVLLPSGNLLHSYCGNGPVEIVDLPS